MNIDKQIELKSVTVKTTLVRGRHDDEMPTRKFENFIAEVWNTKASEYLGIAICHGDNWRDIEFRTRSRIGQVALNQFADRCNTEQGEATGTRSMYPKDWLREEVAQVMLEFINDNEFKTFKHLSVTAENRIG